MGPSHRVERRDDGSEEPTGPAVNFVKIKAARGKLEDEEDNFDNDYEGEEDGCDISPLGNEKPNARKVIEVDVRKFTKDIVRTELVDVVAAGLPSNDDTGVECSSGSGDEGFNLTNVGGIVDAAFLEVVNFVKTGEGVVEVGEGGTKDRRRGNEPEIRRDLQPKTVAIPIHRSEVWSTG